MHPQTSNKPFAQMAESVDALVSNTSGFTSIPVRPRVWVPKRIQQMLSPFFVAYFHTHRKKDLPLPHIIQAGTTMRLFFLLLSLCTLTAYAQVPTLEPKYISRFPNVNIEKIDALRHDERDYETLSQKEKKLLNFIEEDRVLWHFYGGGCSWYCGGIIDTVTASSSLTEEFIANNAHDFRVATAWIDGSKENAIRESITYHFPGNCPRITGISIHNGYVKDKKLWKQYSRVKKLLMYYNNQPYAILNLKDTRDCQDFEVGILGNEIKEDTPAWTIKFEILEVYPGKKSSHAAITEIYFDGIDVH